VKTISQDRGVLHRYYQELYRAWGAQHWWPANSRFEVIVGAYLTQNTAWTNVELALKRLRSAQLLSMTGIRRVAPARLEALIRPAGYFRQKARRLKTFVAFVDEMYRGSLQRMFAQPTSELRRQLLELNGVGPETADSILLYAGNHPVFVVDAYTRRILGRHAILPENAPYEEIRARFESELAPVCQRSGIHIESTPTQRSAHSPSRMSRAKRSTAAQVYNEMHGLIVNVGKYYCRSQEPRCEQCPLQRFLPQASRIQADSRHL
jgi:endonuclease-3 related protein